jgi:serine/threonine protein kinase/tetratricopeptide (TPR) repeat protein
MSSVLDRLRKALAPDIVVERELASGGMGIVFLARDAVLDRPIAIKVLRPELATAVAAERFLREGRAAARLGHPNVVRVHHAAPADGLLYYTMDFVPGETLAARLLRGPLPAGETAAIGRDILGALAAAHGSRLIHRDVKPSNIFLNGTRALLGDFGVACAVESDSTTLTGTGQRVGTLAYMAPEQHLDAPITLQTDLYAVGLALFEACTGRRWESLADPDKADWSEVPRRLRQPLRKALQLAPDERWEDATSFAGALEPSVGRWKRLAPAACLLAVVAYASWPAAHRLLHQDRSLSDLVVFPFETAGPIDTSLGRELAGTTRWYFERLPGLTLRPSKAAAWAWSHSPLPPARRLAELTAAMHSRYGAWGVVRPSGAELEIQMSVVNARGEPVLQAAVHGDSADHVALGDLIGARIIGVVSPGLSSTFRRGGALARVSPEAALEFLQGEDAFARDAWLTAERHYSRALQLDSTFLLAAWRLANARRWMPLRREPPFPPDFLSLFHARAQALSEVDRRLVQAQFAPSGPRRFAWYEEARRAGPGDAYTMLLYGDELFHRGPLAGRPLSEAAAMLDAAAAADPTLAPAWEHLAWSLIRLGRREQAARALDSLGRVVGRPDESEIYLPDFLRIAFMARFDPAAPAAGGESLLRSPAALALAARGALAFDLPDHQLRFGRALATLEGAGASQRASGHTGQGIALVALGRPTEALAQLDSAADLFPDPDEARLQAAEWRIIPRALGVPGFSAEEAARGRALLARTAEQPWSSRRSAWALALDALARGDTVAAADWQRRSEEREATGGPLALLLAAMTEAVRGDPAAALRLSEPALALDSAGYASDPFFRAALHLLRGEWFAAAGRSPDADRSWLWYENTDVIGWPEAEAQPAEVDWALASHARVRRASLAFAQSRGADGCALVRRLLEVWSRPEPAVLPTADRLRRSASRCSP